MSPISSFSLFIFIDCGWLAAKWSNYLFLFTRQLCWSSQFCLSLELFQLCNILQTGFALANWSVITYWKACFTGSTSWKRGKKAVFFPNFQRIVIFVEDVVSKICLEGSSIPEWYDYRREENYKESNTEKRLRKPVWARPVKKELAGIRR